MAQRTLVALYGGKQTALSDAIEHVQRLASAALRGAFEAYEIPQVHATIVGLEHRKGRPRENAAFFRLRNRCTGMDVPGFLAALRASRDLPLEVQVGGFDAADRRFLSRGDPPYQRSFSVQGDKAVVIGWPRRADGPGGSVAYPRTLDALRRRAREFGILHAYHRLPEDVDNDLFFRVGLVDRELAFEDAVRELEGRVRAYLSAQPPLILKIGHDDLKVAAYSDERLPMETTDIRPLSAAGIEDWLSSDSDADA